MRGEGADSRAKRAFRLAEFRKMLEMMREANEADLSIKFACMTILQHNLIGRINDACNFAMADPRGHPEFPFALKIKVSWSKNARDERACPDQIVLGSMDSGWCVLLHKAVWMEHVLSVNADQYYLFTDGPKDATEEDTAVDNLVQTCRNTLKRKV